MEQANTSRSVTQYRDGQVQTGEDRVAVEEPMEIRLGDRPLAVTMRTPGDDEELAAGFCFTEGLFSDPDDLVRVEPCRQAGEQNIIIVTLAGDMTCGAADRAARELYMSSSCGLCGKLTLDRIETHAPPIRGQFTMSRDTVLGLPGAMRETQATFDATGGLHAAALFKPNGTLKLLREDIGRHNAVDKVIGKSVMLGDMPLDDSVLLISGRASFEIMQKAAMAGIAMVCAVSAPSSLAVDFAVRMNMTLVGFLRDGRMNVYHAPGSNSPNPRITP
jgi:FdhD protein